MYMYCERSPHNPLRDLTYITIFGRAPLNLHTYVPTYLKVSLHQHKYHHSATLN